MCGKQVAARLEERKVPLLSPGQGDLANKNVITINLKWLFCDTLHELPGQNFPNTTNNSSFLQLLINAVGNWKSSQLLQKSVGFSIVGIKSFVLIALLFCSLSSTSPIASKSFRTAGRKCHALRIKTFQCSNATFGLCTTSDFRYLLA